jgi:hypothetical protein
MTTAYNRIDRILREKLSDDDYPTYKEELDAICQAKIQRTWVGLTEQERNDIENDFEAFISIHVFDAIEAKLKEKNT